MKIKIDKRICLLLSCTLFICAVLTGCNKAAPVSASSDETAYSQTETTTAEGETSEETSETSWPETGPAAEPSTSRPKLSVSDPASASTSDAQPEPPRSDTPSVPAPPADPQPPADDGRITVTLSVDCRTAVALGYEEAIDTAADGDILSATPIVLDKGATAYDLLQYSGLDVEAKASITGQYVTSIQFLAEKQCGPASGWMYSVNGEFPGKSCSKYTLADGDVVAWRYTCSNGTDLK